MKLKTLNKKAEIHMEVKMFQVSSFKLQIAGFLHYQILL